MRYALYMQEYLEEAEAEVPVKKPKPYKENFYFQDHLQLPKVREKLEKQSVRDSIVDYVGEFLDKHEKELSTPGPVYPFTYGTEEAKFLYELFGTTPEEVFGMYTKMVEETWNGKISVFFTTWVKNAPHKILITAMLIEALQKEYDDIVECCAYLWIFSEYALVFRIYWKTIVREDVMKYTIEHLSAKYKVKKCKNLQELMYYDAMCSIRFMEPRLMTGMDHTYTDLLYRMRNQFKNTFANIAHAYFDNIENNATLHNRDSQFDDGSLADTEGHNTVMAQVIDRTISKFSTNTLNQPMLRVAADGSNVDRGNLEGYLNQIMATKQNRLPKMIEDIITSYLLKEKTNTGTLDSGFLNYGLAMYRSLSGSKDPLLKEIREILDYWMNDIIDIRSSYKHQGTIIAYTRAIFNYVILMIHYYNN